MSIFSQYEDDIFFNYSRADNANPKDHEDRGWVDALHEYLGCRLKVLTGFDAQIWRDRERMLGHGVLEETLWFKLRNVALLLSVLSPSYLTSKWCIPELNAFYTCAAKEGKTHINNKSRIFKVIKIPIEPEEKQPPELRDLPGYKFYKKCPPNGMPREYSHIPGWDTYKDFVKELETLAWDISRFVELCQSSNPYSRTVYLAETSPELRAERDEVKKELETHNYHVLPDRPLPTDGPKFKEAVRDYLKRSRMSIHLIGGETSFIPAGDKRDIVYLQHSLALERHASSDFFRVVWTPRGLKPRGTVQQSFINLLRTKAKFQKDAELLLGNTRLANLKTNVLEKLREWETHDAAGSGKDRAESGGDPASIYLIFDKKDWEDVRPLCNYLGKKYKVKWPVMEAGGRRNREEHRRNLSECDVAIIFYGKASELWVREKLNELDRIVVSGRTKPRPFSTVYITEPLNPAKEFWESGVDYHVLRTPAQFSEGNLEPLVNEIQKRFPQAKSQGMPR